MSKPQYKLLVVLLGPVELTSGIVALTEDQVRRRKNKIVPVKGKSGLEERELFEIKETVQFKQGEIIGYPGDAPKYLSDKLVDPDAAEAEPVDDEKYIKDLEDENDALITEKTELLNQVEQLKAELGKTEQGKGWLANVFSKKEPGKQNQQ